jgi:hypothetical protein
MFWVLAEIGMRGGEVCAFSVDDVSFEDQMIVVRRSTLRGRLQTPNTTKAVKAMSIPESLMAHLRCYLEHD